MPRFRMLDWWLIAAVLMIAIAVIAPHQLGVTIYKLSLVSLAAVIGYRIDCSLFPDGRPHMFRPEETALAAAWLRRALIVAACMIAVSLGA